MTHLGQTCDDCYFRRHSLCALDLEQACPTFRPAARTLQPITESLLARPTVVTTAAEEQAVAPAAA